MLQNGWMVAPIKGAIFNLTHQPNQRWLQVGFFFQTIDNNRLHWRLKKEGTTIEKGHKNKACNGIKAKYWCKITTNYIEASKAISHSIDYPNFAKTSTMPFANMYTWWDSTLKE